MPKLNADLPSVLKPYVFHGVGVLWKPGEKQAKCDCPFCGREGKLSINAETGQWRCLVCAEGSAKGGGNVYIFLRQLWNVSDAATKDYAGLAQDRRLYQPESLMHWGVCRSILTGEWLVPGYGPDGHLNQLYRYVRSSDRMLLLPTPTLGHQMFGMPLFNARKRTVYLCEGPWDGIALWETLQHAKVAKNGLAWTSSKEKNMLADASVLACAGTGAVGEPMEKFLSLFAGKIVNLMFDNDHPRENPKTGTYAEPAGLSAVKRMGSMLLNAKRPPAAIHWLKWGSSQGWEGVDLDKPSGFDVRDKIAI